MASRAPARRDTCERKRRYATWAHAQNDARAIRWKSHEHVEVYHCGVCRGIHVGHVWVEGRL